MHRRVFLTTSIESLTVLPGGRRLVAGLGWLPGVLLLVLLPVRLAITAEPVDLGVLALDTIQPTVWANGEVAPREILLIEEREIKADEAERRVDVFVYDYGRQLTEYRLIDPVRQRVVASASLAQHHLPLNFHEQDRVRYWLTGHRDWVELLQRWLPPMPVDTDTDPLLKWQISVYEPHFASLSAVSSVASCAIARCAVVRIGIEGHDVLPIEPVIRLLDGRWLNTLEWRR